MYKFKTKPYAHQLEALRLLEGREYYALFMEQGTGKTKVLLDDAGRLWTEGKIDGLIVLADNGIHRNWITDEAPAHLNIPWQGLVWSSGKAKAKYFQAKFTELCSLPAECGLPILAMNIDAVITPTGKKALNSFVKRKAVMVIVDESTSIKTPGAKRTKTSVALGRHAVYRRIATGTPYAEGPLDIYAPCRFLSDSILNCRSFLSFKHEYADWEARQTQTGRSYQVLISYRNLDRLKALMAPHSYRVLKADCLDLPPKIYQKRYFELGKEQRRIYDKLREDYLLEMSGEVFDIQRTMTRRMRLQQIASGYRSTGVKDGIERLKDNARLEALTQYLEGLPNGCQCIIWARFTPDCDEICSVLGDSAVRYDGSVGAEQRARAIEAFQNGGAKYFVGTAKAGGKGLTLTAAQQVLYYSNDDPLIHRLQSEDRAHRIGQKHSVVYVDFVAVDTIDESLVAALRDKKEISDLITGDPKSTWL